MRGRFPPARSEPCSDPGNPPLFRVLRPSGDPFTGFGMWIRLRGLAVVSALICIFWPAISRARTDELRGGRVTAGQLSTEGETLVAGAEGATLSLEHGAVLRAEPGARFRFGKFTKLHLGPGSDPDPLWLSRVLTLEQGYLTTTIPADRRYAILVMTPRKLRGILIEGEASVVASEQRATFANHSGRVLWTVDERWRPLPAGSEHLASEAYPLGLRRSMLGMPSLPLLSRRLLLEGAAASESTTTVTWPALAGAAEYDVRLERSDGTLIQRVRLRDARWVLGPLTAGDYRITVRGIDDSGVPGAVGSPVALNVVGLDVPKTASRGPNGAVRLQPGQRVGLLGADGLEVGYLGFDDFLPAPKTLGLVARRPISMRLRHPGTGETVRLDLEPMTVRAEIMFSRQPHEWPKQGLQIGVKLIDEQGYEVPEAFNVRCKVTVNIEPAEPTWQRSGSTLHTLLERPEGPGPWMVRVEVVDESGIPLGKDFSEVAYAPPRHPQKPGAPRQAPSQQRQAQR